MGPGPKQVDGPDGPLHWRTEQIQPDGSFTVDTVIEEGKTMVVQAWFDSTDRRGSAVSNELILKQSFPR